MDCCCLSLGLILPGLLGDWRTGLSFVLPEMGTEGSIHFPPLSNYLCMRTSQMSAAGNFWYLLQWLSNIDPWTSSDVTWDPIRNAFASYTQHMQQELCEWGPAICLHKPPRRFRCTLGCVNHSFRVLNQGPLSPQGSFGKIWRHWLS